MARAIPPSQGSRRINLLCILGFIRGRLRLVGCLVMPLLVEGVEVHAPSPHGRDRSQEALAAYINSNDTPWFLVEIEELHKKGEWPFTMNGSSPCR